MKSLPFVKGFTSPSSENRHYTKTFVLNAVSFDVLGMLNTAQDSVTIWICADTFGDSVELLPECYVDRTAIDPKKVDLAREGMNQIARCLTPEYCVDLTRNKDPIPVAEVSPAEEGISSFTHLEQLGRYFSEQEAQSEQGKAWQSFQNWNRVVSNSQIRTTDPMFLPSSIPREIRSIIDLTFPDSSIETRTIASQKILDIFHREIQKQNRRTR